MACPVWHRDGQGVLIGLRISVRPIRWCFEVTDDRSPFSTHEHDDGLPRTYGRREWGFYTGTEFETAQPRFGHIGLDRYKDWIVDHPEGPAGKGAYPGGFFSKEHVARLRRALDQNPAAAQLKNRYLMSGRAEDAICNARSVIAKLKKEEVAYPERDFWLWGKANYRKAQLMIFANEAEDALACPELPAELRAELRRWLTLYAYVTSDPDWNPRGAGVHLGNNNMPINRTLALAYFAGLLPDHPCYAYWMKCLRDFTEFKLTTQFSPGGESIECPTYSTYAPAGALNIAQNVLRHRGIADLTANGITRRNLEYMANLTVPDPRFGGARIIPGMGNSSNDQDSVWGVSVATFADRDPAFAGWCKAMFEAAGASFGPISTGVTFVGHPMYYLPDVKDSPLEFKTVFMPAYGVVFRAHAAEGPSYFVLRDTFPGGEGRSKWWTWLNLEGPDKICVDGTAFEKDKVPVETVIAEADMPRRRGQTLDMATDFGASSWCWFTEPYDFRVRAVMQYPASHGARETKTIVEALAGAGQDYFYVVFPKKNGEPAPACEKLADGALKITTAEAGDYAFVSDAPIRFEREGVLFEGRAGAVRVFKDRVALCMNSGSGRIGYQGMIFEGPGPFEAKLDGETIRIKTTGRARMLHVTQPPFIIRPQY